MGHRRVLLLRARAVAAALLLRVPPPVAVPQAGGPWVGRQGLLGPQLGGLWAGARGLLGPRELRRTLRAGDLLDSAQVLPREAALVPPARESLPELAPELGPGSAPEPQRDSVQGSRRRARLPCPARLRPAPLQRLPPGVALGLRVVPSGAVSPVPAAQELAAPGPASRGPVAQGSAAQALAAQGAVAQESTVPGAAAGRPAARGPAVRGPTGQRPTPRRQTARGPTLQPAVQWPPPRDPQRRSPAGRGPGPLPRAPAQGPVGISRAVVRLPSRVALPAPSAQPGTVRLPRTTMAGLPPRVRTTFVRPITLPTPPTLTEAARVPVVHKPRVPHRPMYAATQLVQAFPNHGPQSSAAWIWRVPPGSLPAIAYWWVAKAPSCAWRSMRATSTCERRRRKTSLPRRCHDISASLFAWSLN